MLAEEILHMSICAIWGKPARVEPVAGSLELLELVSVRTGGRYRINRDSLKQVANLSFQDCALLTTSLIEERSSGNHTPTIDQETLPKFIKRRPMTYSKKIDRFFDLLTDQRYDFSDIIILSNPPKPDRPDWLQLICAWCEFSKDNQATAFIHNLMDAGLLRVAGRNASMALTPEGWSRLEAFQTANVDRDQAFVAMWFDSSMDQPYFEGIKLGVIDAGYKPKRIDEGHFTDKIDNQIIAEIRRSKFLIADFTCGSVAANGSTTSIPRGGVYFEAGFAMGLGIPVIWTVRKDQAHVLHFDTRQYPHILWNDVQDLRNELKFKILATLGEGPHFGETA